MLRKLFAILLFGLAALTTWMRGPLLPDPAEPVVTAHPAMDAPYMLAPGIAVTGLWELRSTQRRFGGFSALTFLESNDLRAFTDFGYALDLPVPGSRGVVLRRALRRVEDGGLRKMDRDIEAATYHEGITWIALEGRDAIVRFGPGLRRQGEVRPALMAEWGGNSGAESIARLKDGRFLVLDEGAPLSPLRSDVRGVLFGNDPVDGAPGREITLAGNEDYRPVDATVTPDGRVLVLLRKLELGFGYRFSTRIALLDPADLGDGRGGLMRLVDLAPPLPSDNFEGIAVREAHGRWEIWLISDDNNSHFQRNWLLRLEIESSAT